ncbi:hypothetical protein AURDEDRAFT_183403, partial [Auricularia subglabra TFB-10046 SS5]
GRPAHRERPALHRACAEQRGARELRAPGPARADAEPRIRERLAPTHRPRDHGALRQRRAVRRADRRAFDDLRPCVRGGGVNRNIRHGDNRAVRAAAPAGGDPPHAACVHARAAGRRARGRGALERPVSRGEPGRAEAGARGAAARARRGACARGVGGARRADGAPHAQLHSGEQRRVLFKTWVRRRGGAQDAAWVHRQRGRVHDRVHGQVRERRKVEWLRSSKVCF